MGNYAMKIHKGVGLFLVIVLLIGLFTGCGPTDSDGQSEETKGHVVLGNGTSRSEDDVTLDASDVEPMVNSDMDTVADDGDSAANVDDAADVASDDEVEPLYGDQEFYEGSMFGNPPYTEACTIEYYTSPSTETGAYQFEQIFGLHVADNQLLAVEDTIVATVIDPEQFSEDELYDLVQNMYQQMEAANFERANQQEILDAFNGYGNDSAMSFVYYVHDAELDHLSDYAGYLNFFVENGYSSSW